MKLSEWLAREKESRGLTQSEFAKGMEMDPSTITKALNGQRRPDWATLEKISKATGGEVMPNDFLQEIREAEARGAAA